MKKVLILMLGMVAATVLNAQNYTNGVGSNTFMKFTTDFNITNTVAGWALIDASKDFKSTQDVLVNLDSVSGNHTKITCSLWGRKFTGDAWTQIGSNIIWYSVGNDTSIIFSNTTAARWREFKVNAVGTGTGVTKLSYIWFKLWLE